MKIVKTINEMQKLSREAKEKGKTIGFVPTMGYLHEGHLSLIRAAREECDVVVVSIFVNPTQFGLGEDLEKYPRDMDRDEALVREEGADIIFAPSAEEMYPEGCYISVEAASYLTEGLCAKSRPGHFDGVATVVSKLFSSVSPDKSYFGQKDAQQALVIKRMVKDLNLPVEVRVMPIVRERDGLAMSSRNTYLSEDERDKALCLYWSLKKAEELVADGQTSVVSIKEEMEKILMLGDAKIDYIEITNADDLKSLKEVKGDTLIAVAAFIGDTRLIDNIVIKER